MKNKNRDGLTRRLLCRRYGKKVDQRNQEKNRREKGRGEEEKRRRTEEESMSGRGRLLIALGQHPCHGQAYSTSGRIVPCNAPYSVLEAF